MKGWLDCCSSSFYLHDALNTLPSPLKMTSLQTGTDVASLGSSPVIQKFSSRPVSSPFISTFVIRILIGIFLSNFKYKRIKITHVSSRITYEVITAVKKFEFSVWDLVNTECMRWNTMCQCCNESSRLDSIINAISFKFYVPSIKILKNYIIKAFDT